MPHTINDLLPAYAVDIKKTLSTALLAPYISEKQAWGSMYAAALATRQPQLIEAVFEDCKKRLSRAEINAARMAASVMSMNNIYWRFWYLVEDEEYMKMPAELSQETFDTHGVELVEFECFALAVSAINNCKGCLKVHSRKLQKLGFTKEQVMHVVRIAAVTHGAATAIATEAH